MLSKFKFYWILHLVRSNRLSAEHSFRLFNKMEIIKVPMLVQKTDTEQKSEILFSGFPL